MELKASGRSFTPRHLCLPACCETLLNEEGGLNTGAQLLRSVFRCLHILKIVSCSLLHVLLLFTCS